MNWVGGVRRRVLQRDEVRRRQEIFFAAHALPAQKPASGYAAYESYNTEYWLKYTFFLNWYSLKIFIHTCIIFSWSAYFASLHIVTWTSLLGFSSTLILAILLSWSYTFRLKPLLCFISPALNISFFNSRNDLFILCSGYQQRGSTVSAGPTAQQGLRQDPSLAGGGLVSRYISKSPESISL